MINIILNEHEWAREKIEEPEFGKHPTETFRIIARYYMDNGYSKKQAREMIDRYILQCDRNASLVLWERAADSAVRQAIKRQAILIDEVIITKPELEVIDGIKGTQAQRLAFTVLCLSKYWDVCREDNNHWVTNKHSDIMNMANIRASIKKQGALYRQLEQAGLLDFPARIDAISMHVRYALDGEPALHISDFRNLGYQYLMYKGGNFFQCEECGITTKIKNPGVGRPPKYCPSCAAKVRTRQNVNAVMRCREAISNTESSHDVIQSLHNVG